MSKLQEYIKMKKIQELGLPKLYIVKSSIDGVEKPIERQVLEIIENVSFRGEERIPSDRYRIDYAPYTIDILRGETSNKNDSYGTGVGDLWSLSYFSSLSLDEAEQYYIFELERVKNKYIK